ncbi:MAG: DUF5067 domain-containing protein [Clostridia bacterium]|nr:DUF5067 domain-containing protein [Clostridia bacterium]
MSNNNADFLPRMIERETEKSNNTVPELPVMPPEIPSGGTPAKPPKASQGSNLIDGFKKMFSKFPIQLAIMLVASAGIAIGLAALAGALFAGAPEENTAAPGVYPNIAVSLIADARTGGADDGQTADPQAATTAAPATAYGEGKIGECYVKVVESKTIEDDWGDKHIVVIFDFTNNSEYATWISSELSFYAEQSGVEVDESTFFFDEYYETLGAEIQPGATARAGVVFEVTEDDSSDISVKLCNLWEENEAITYTAKVN